MIPLLSKSTARELVVPWSKAMMKELQEKLVATMKHWQGIEAAAVASTTEILQQTDNPLIRLVAEIIHSGDHRTDTVVKKAIYEQHRVPRLWMIDPRYDNVEVYHTGEYGLALKHILAGRESLAEDLLPSFQMVITELFKD